jgi:GT2 family glycosyltransferase
MNWAVSAANLIAPVAVAEIELSEPAMITYQSVAVPDDGRSGLQALVLVRLHAEPIGTIIVEAPGGMLDTAVCAEAAWAFLGGALAEHLARDGMPGEPPVAPERDTDGALRCRRALTAGLVSTPFISVIVATRERPDSLASCLDALGDIDYPLYEIIVVDNAPVTDETERLVMKKYPDVHYVRNCQRGLAAAHNVGLEAARGRIVAFTDDDVIVDRRWLAELARAFAEHDGVACVTGLIMPAELQTPTQILLESFGNFGKGFRQRLMDLGKYRPDEPLFPFTAGRLGSGANMAFDAEILRGLGGFDPAIGTGTVARGGDDLAAFFAVITAGHRLVYQPSALLWHRHRSDPDALESQAFGYGVGVGAYLASALTNSPVMIGRVLIHAPAALAYALLPSSPRQAHLRGVWSKKLVWLERRGMAYGPFAYGISRWRTRGSKRPGRRRIPANRSQTLTG